MDIIAIVVVFWIACGVGAYFIAKNRGGEDPQQSGLMGLLFGPFGLLLAAASGPAPDAIEGRVCQHCGKVVGRYRQKICNHCGRAFEG